LLLQQFAKELFGCLRVPMALHIPVAQGERVIETDTVANNFAGESMTGIHEIGIVNGVESVRLFYLWVKLTIP
jgi:hypothetical protein